MRIRSAFAASLPIVCLLVCFLATASAQRARPQAARQAGPQSAQAMCKQAHQLAKSAKTLKDLNSALEICGKVSGTNPAPEQKAYIHKLASWTYNRRGEMLVEMAEEIAGSDPQQAKSYEHTAVQDFGLSAQFDSTNWKPRFNRAVSVAMLGNYETALSDLDFVISKKPTHQNAIFNRAEILLQLGEYDRAAADYATILKANPNDAAAYAGRGIALSALGETKAALQDLNAVVRLKPEEAVGYVDRADLYSSMGNWERAAGDYRVAIGLDNSIGRAYQNVAWLMATCPEQRFRDPALAVRAAKRAIELDGQTHLGLDTYAAALAATGEYEKAVAAQKRAVDVAPAEEKQDLAKRLALYQTRRPFVDPTVESDVQLATALEEVVSEVETETVQQ